MATERLPPPEPGIYHNVPFQDYARWDAFHFSNANLLRKSPAHYFYAEFGKPVTKKSKSLAIGELLHAMVLGGSSVNPLTSDLSTKDQTAVFNMRRKLYTHPLANILIDKDNPNREVSICWKDSHTGTICKARLDFYFDEAPKFMGDLKTCRDASYNGFRAAIHAWGYDMQAGLYLRGMRQLGHDFDSYIFLCIENTPPYEIGVFRLLSEKIKKGEAKILELMTIYETARREGIWASYPTEIQDISDDDQLVAAVAVGGEDDE